MMMSRPPQKEEAPPKPATAPPKSSSEAVQDLERRLAMLGDVTEEVKPEEKKQENPPPPVSQPQAAPVKGGKNALLARIMAAQERAKMAGHKQEDNPQQPNLLAPPATEQPPPAFDQAFALPPPAEEAQEAPPPPFEAVEEQQKQQEPPPPSFDAIEHTVAPPPTYEPTVVAPPISAPPYEDLLDHAPQSTLLEGIEPMQAPAAASSVEEEILMMEGLSEEERKALVNEQRRIMDQIATEKVANEKAIAAAQADAFDSRSAPAVARAASDMPSPPAETSHDELGVPRSVFLGDGQEVALHGQERTRAAIEAGTAIFVVCMNCQNWMQVTDTATLMYCPVCSVISPVERQSAVMTKEEVWQMSADRKIAEQLQNEEYKEAEEPEESWWESITSVFTYSKTKKPADGPAPPQILARGEVGVTRPPGSPERTGLMPARTGEEETEVITFSNSHDEQEGLLASSGGAHLPKARVAEQKPLFSCVVDSVSSAASSLGTALTAHNLHEDQEGNVHGVDASSLLAVTRASRETEYQALPENEQQS